MGGVYVAKPDAESVPDLPPDWNPEWPFPGPFPPGYEPELTLGLTAPTSMIPESSVSGVAVTLKDHTTYATAAPTEQLTWTATLKSSGDTVQLRQAGIGDYADTLSSSYLLSAGFYAISVDLDFDVAFSDVGDYVVLQASSYPFGTTAVAEEEVEIAIVCAIASDEGDCEEDCTAIDTNGTLEPCDNAVESSPTTTYIGSWDVTTCTEDASDQCTAAQRSAATAVGAQAEAKRTEWATAYGNYCQSKADAEDYECQIGEKQCVLAQKQAYLSAMAACSSSTQEEVDAAQAAVNETQDEIDALGDLQDGAEAARDGYLASANTLCGEMDTLADQSMTLADVAAPNNCLYLYSAAPGTEPCPNYECADLGPTCGGRNPLRCVVTWIVQQKYHFYHTCPADEAWEFHGSWNKVMTGGYTISGKPYVKTLTGCSGVPGDACVSTDCSAGDEECGAGCKGDTATYEVQLLKYYSTTTEATEC